ncbi:unnamed protein product [Urochloa decumbens]|uniref:Uncharacterized protein n=1 Tax=Urochloa decumbens TaxID=240449 RepID=A0ABC8Y4S7_9POAL
MAEHQLGVTGDGQATAHAKLQRLEMLLVRIHAAVEVSEKHAAAVQCRRDALKEATSEGDEALAFFRQRAMDDARDTKNSNEELGDDASSSTEAAAAAGALFFTRSALSSSATAQGDSTNVLFSGDYDTKRLLNTVVEKLEQLAPDVEEFIRLLQLEILPKIEQTWPTTKKRPPPYPLPPLNTEAAGTTPRGEAIWDEFRSEMYGVAPWRPMEAWVADSPEYEDYKAWGALRRRLSPLVVGGRIGWAVKMMSCRDIDIMGTGSSGALAQWAAVFREVDRRGWDVLLDADRCLGKYSCFNDDKLPTRCDLGRAKGEVRRVVRGHEMLVGDVESFGGLVVLCPWDFSVR